jgi:hypothetical protein
MATNQKTDQYFATFDKSLQNEKTDQGRLINKKRWDALRSVAPSGMTTWSFNFVYREKYIQGERELSASEIKARPDYQYWVRMLERAAPQYRAFQEKRTATDAGLAPMSGGSDAKRKRELRRLLVI